MAAIFLEFVNVSISAGWLILAILLLRWIFPKIPKRARLVFWGLVGLRLILFVSVESAFSLIPSARTIPRGIMFMPCPEITSGLSRLDKHKNPVIAKTFAPTPENSVNPLQIVFFVLAVLWIAGVAALLLAAGIRALRLRRRLKDAVLLEENIYQSENISAPFLFGLRHPRIYLPAAMGQDAAYYMVLHEQMHIARHDHWKKIFGYFLLCLYWFHPLCHVAYRLFCRDMELACDEQVIRGFSENLGISEKREFSEKEQENYARAMSVLCAPRREASAVAASSCTAICAPCRETHLCLAVFLGIFLAVCFLTNPKEKTALKEEYRRIAETGLSFANGQISLQKDGSFTLIFSGLSSYIAQGAYEVSGGRLMLWTMRGEWYVFDVVGDTLVFDADASTEVHWWNDGDIFK